MLSFAACGLALSVLLVRDTAPHVAAESEAHGRSGEWPPIAGLEPCATAVSGEPSLGPAAQASLGRAFAQATWRDRRLFGASQAGFVNNLNDALAWGIFPLYFASRGLGLDRIAFLAAAYPLVWGSLQVTTGWLSDATGRRPLVAGGMLLQGGAIALVAMMDSFAAWTAGVVLLGAGTAMVYPTLLASVGDAVHPQARATTLGVYRFWRDGGAIAGALAAGALADAFGFAPRLVPSRA